MEGEEADAEEAEASVEFGRRIKRRLGLDRTSVWEEVEIRLHWRGR